MIPPHQKSPLKHPAPERRVICWHFFLLFFHLLPAPWYLLVAAGLAPPSFFLAIGIVSLFLVESGSLIVGFFMIAAAFLYGLFCYLLAWLVMHIMVRIPKPVFRTLALIGLTAVCLGAAMTPIYISGGHHRSSAFSLFDFVRLLGEFRIPPLGASVYFTGLGISGAGLIAAQHILTTGGFRISECGGRRFKRIREVLLASTVIALLIFFGWTHRVLLLVRPLADLGIASAQFQLALAIKARPGAEFQGDYDYIVLLKRAAAQGHGEAARLLAKSAPSIKERSHWLTVAAKGGAAEAQYELFRARLKTEAYEKARHWLVQAAAANFGEAQYFLGKYYMEGHTGLGYAQDRLKARQWWEKAAENGNGHAMEALAWRYEKGADGFPYNPERAIALLALIKEGYQKGIYGLGRHAALAVERSARAERIRVFQDKVARGDPEALARLGWALVGAVKPSEETVAKGLELLSQAAAAGDPELQYELGKLFLLGRQGVAIDFERGRGWWDKALAADHLETMEYVAPAYQNGRFGYPVDLLKSKALVERLVAGYGDDADGRMSDPAKAQYWRQQLKHFDRLFKLSGGAYESPEALREKALAGDVKAQYQLGRQLMISGPPGHRQQGLEWIERAAENGHAEAQYRLVTYFERQAGIMRTDPQRGVAFLTAAAEQNHLRAMESLALGYYKGRPGLERDLNKAKIWYERLLAAYESGDYQGEIDAGFIPYQRQRLQYTIRALAFERQKELRYQNATPHEKQVLDIEEKYRLKYQQDVNNLVRRNRGRLGKEKMRAERLRLKTENHRRRDEEIARLKE